MNLKYNQEYPDSKRMKIRASIYCRVSTAAQAEPNRISIPEQVRHCKNLIHDRGWDLVYTYIDPGYSSSTLNRPGLQQMLKQLDAFHVLVVHDPDRLSRDNALVEATIYNELDAHRVQMTSITQPIHIVDPIQYDPRENDTVFIQRKISGLSGGLDNRRRRRRLIAGIDARERSGYCCKPRAYGYTAEWKQRIVDGKMVIEKATIVVDADAVIVRRIFNDFIGGKSALSIARGLNADRVPSKKRTLWTGSVILEILQNPVYTGKVRKNFTPVINGKKVRKPKHEWIIVDGKHPPIVSFDVYQCAQQVLDRRAKRRRAVSSTRLLSGLVKCGYCGWSMAMEGAYKEGRGRYICNKWKNSRLCDRNPIQIGKVEKGVLHEISRLSDDTGLLQEVERMSRGGEEDALKNELSRLTIKFQQYPSRQRNLFELVETQAISKQVFLARKGEQDEEIDDLKRRIDQCQKQLVVIAGTSTDVQTISKALNEFVQNYDKYDIISIKQNLFDLIDSIEVKNDQFYLKYRFSSVDCVVASKDATHKSTA